MVNDMSGNADDSTYPSILIKAPKGTVNLLTVSGTPLALTHLKVTGSVAAELALPQP